MGLVIAQDIDGGGFYGLSTLRMMDLFWQLVRKARPDLQAWDQLAHLRAGNSFGAITQIGLSRKVGSNKPFFTQPADLLDYMEREGAAVFPSSVSSWFKRRLLGGTIGLFSSHYSADPLRQILHDMIGADTWLSDLAGDIMIPFTVTDPEYRVRFVKTWKARGDMLSDGEDKLEKDYPAWAVARASAAALPYLPGIEITNRAGQPMSAIDGAFGGVNNLSSASMIEIFNMYGVQTRVGGALPHDLLHLSFGTAEIPKSNTSARVRGGGMLPAASVMIKAPIAAAPTASTYLTRALLGDDQYFRFEINWADIRPSDRPNADMTDTSPDQIKRLIAAGEAGFDQNLPRMKKAVQILASHKPQTKQDLIDQIQNSTDICLQPINRGDIEEPFVPAP